MRVHQVGRAVLPPGRELIGQFPDALRDQVTGVPVLGGAFRCAGTGPAGGAAAAGGWLTGTAAWTLSGSSTAPGLSLLRRGRAAGPGLTVVGRAGYSCVHRDLCAQPGQGGGERTEAGSWVGRIGILGASQRAGVIGDQGDSHGVGSSGSPDGVSPFPLPAPLIGKRRAGPGPGAPVTGVGRRAVGSRAARVMRVSPAESGRGPARADRLHPASPTGRRTVLSRVAGRRHSLAAEGMNRPRRVAGA